VSRSATSSGVKALDPDETDDRVVPPAAAYAGPVRILVVSQMYPGPEAPDLGTFVAQVERELGERGHEVELAVLDTRAGGKARYLTLARRTLAAAKPDVVYAHFLVPSGLVAALAGRAPLVVTAHGRDVRNVGSIPGIAAATRLVVRRAAAVICVSDYLRRELETKLPEARGKVEVVSSGVDRERFAPTAAPSGPPAFLCVGSLDERKNVIRLAEAFAQLEEGTLTFAGDGPLRAELEGRERVSLLGRVPHGEIPRLLAESRVLAQPSLVEPLGQALLEAMACGRSVVATRIGGPPEFVSPEAGVLVDPLDVDALARALATAAALPCPNGAARDATEEHDVRRQGARIEEILSRAAARRTRDPRA
jgi:glycosyltransferase involved in cell wall biosynthesis